MWMLPFIDYRFNMLPNMHPNMPHLLISHLTACQANYIYEDIEKKISFELNFICIE